MFIGFCIIICILFLFWLLSVLFAVYGRLRAKDVFGFSPSDWSFFQLVLSFIIILLCGLL